MASQPGSGDYFGGTKPPCVSKYVDASVRLRLHRVRIATTDGEDPDMFTSTRHSGQLFAVPGAAWAGPTYTADGSSCRSRVDGAIMGV